MKKEIKRIKDIILYWESFLKTDVQYFEKLHELNNDLPFLPERMKIERVEKLLAILDDKTECFIHIIILK